MIGALLRPTFAGAILALACIAGAQAAPGLPDAPDCALPTAELAAPDLFARCASCLDQGEMRRAVTLYHAAMVRMGALARVSPQDRSEADKRSALTLALRAVLEGPVLTWAAGDIPSWIASIGEALAWDEKTPFAAGNRAAQEIGLSADQWQSTRFEARLVLHSFINELRAQRDQIYLARSRANVPVRDPSWSKARAAAVSQQRQPHDSHSHLPSDGSPHNRHTADGHAHH